MRHIFYVEGYSEENFIESFLLFNNFEYTKDIGEFISENARIYLKNCKSDSAIRPSILKDKWWIQKINPTSATIWVVCDLEEFSCYRSLATTYKEFLVEEGIRHKLIIINSRPNLETIYFENIEHIFKTVLALHNTTFPQNILQDPSQLTKHELILNPDNKHIYCLKNFCRENLKNFNKNEFSEKFFFSFFPSSDATTRLSICERLEYYLSIL